MSSTGKSKALPAAVNVRSDICSGPVSAPSPRRRDRGCREQTSSSLKKMSGGLDFETNRRKNFKGFKCFQRLFKTGCEEICLACASNVLRLGAVILCYNAIVARMQKRRVKVPRWEMMEVA